MRKWLLGRDQLATVLFLCVGTGANAATIVDSIGTGSTWDFVTQDSGGTAAIVDLTAELGNPDAGAPLPIGAARLTTNQVDASKAEIGTNGNFGTVSNIFSTNLSFSYSYYKAQNGPNDNVYAAPALRLLFYNPGYDGNAAVDTSGDFMQLVYEPYWNLPPTYKPPTDTWQNVSIDLDSGDFWSQGGLGMVNSAGGPPLRTLGDWLTYSLTLPNQLAFSQATLVRVLIGVGTDNADQVGYFDKVSIVGTLRDGEYNFEVVPLPPAGVLLFTGLAGLCFLTWRRTTKCDANRSKLQSQLV